MLIVPIDSTVKQRETKWVCVCPVCQHERIISYAQKWNIETGKNSDKCRSCRVELKEVIPNLIGLTYGRKYHKKQTKIKNLGITYQNLFNNYSKNSDAKIKMRNAKLGKYEKNANSWRGGKTSERKLEMSRDKYKKWRQTIFERDNYTCQFCKKRGGELEVDHILPWSTHKELRYSIDNGRVLCKPCHKTTDTYGYKCLKYRKKDGI